MTNVRGSKLRTDRQTVISDGEFLLALGKAGKKTDKFLRLRNVSILCLLRLTGKRRGEIATVPFENVKVEKDFLNVTFILEKKRRGNILQKLSTKSIPLSDPLASYIVEYYEHLKGLDAKPKFLFPRVRSVFGFNTIIADKHISGRQVFNIVRECSETIWCHLFRETVASDIVKQDGSIIAAFRVQRRLDLEDFRTGFNYLRRFAADIIKKENEG